MRDIKDDNDAEIMYVQRVLGHTFLSTLVLDAKTKSLTLKELLILQFRK